jgi:hypothetical protein
MKLNLIIGQHTFPDGRRIPVYEDAVGRRYVIDKDGWRSYGDWQPNAPPEAEDVTDLGAGDETGL